MLAKICSRRQKQTEFSNEFFAGVLRVNSCLFDLIKFNYFVIVGIMLVCVGMVLMIVEHLRLLMLEFLYLKQKRLLHLHLHQRHPTYPVFLQ